MQLTHSFLYDVFIFTNLLTKVQLEILLAWLESWRLVSESWRLGICADCRLQTADWV